MYFKSYFANIENTNMLVKELFDKVYNKEVKIFKPISMEQVK